MQAMKAGLFLVGTGEGGEPGIGVQRAEEGEANGCAGAAGILQGPFLFALWFGGIVASDAVGDDNGRVSGEVGSGELGPA